VKLFGLITQLQQDVQPVDINMNLLKELLKLNNKDLNEEALSEAVMDDLVTKALDAFWDVITKQYPNIKPEKLPHDALMKFEEFDKEALKIVTTLVSSSTFKP
jgi:hypothetical protein